jgi:hypothetical protein
MTKLSTKQKRTVIRTVRLTKELDEILAEEAKLKRTNLNSLMFSIFVKYAEWDRYAERIGHISVPTTLFRALVDLISDEDALAKLADRLGVELVKETTLFWFRAINQETLLRFLSLAFKYGGAAEIKIEDEGPYVTLIVYHKVGRKGSIFYEHYFDKMIRTYLKAIPEFESTENSVTVRFQKR